MDPCAAYQVHLDLEPGEVVDVHFLLGQGEDREDAQMVVGQVSLKNISGPITIADYAGQSASMGWLPYLSFLALISISLGVLNLLPIPLLDGGHLMYYMAEILKGSPVSERAMEIGQQVGMALLMVLMAFAFYNDINRLFSGQ